MAAAFHLAGYRHVIGTLWSLNDASAARVAADVYRRLAERTPGAHRGVSAPPAKSVGKVSDPGDRKQVRRPPTHGQGALPCPAPPRSSPSPVSPMTGAARCGGSGRICAATGCT
ncbi:CHAT domain-containing protein [Nonomuraea sp. ZG12]|uniref:CHAT domain-containing protein n=1 Tax=Nonomuraea sp. ZG12 TaxID=3452207 RepID=UPI003F88AC5A